MQDLIEEFLNYLIVEKGCAKSTITNYRYCLNLFILFLEKNEIEKIQEITRKHISQFMFYLSELEYLPQSRCLALSALKSFFKFSMREEYISQNPTLAVDNPKFLKKIPDILTCEEVEMLIDCIDETDLMEARDRAIIELLYGSGLRISEALGAKICHLSSDFKSIKVIYAKGGKQRIVPVSPRFIESLKYYFRFRRSDNLKQEDFLFTKFNGQGMKASTFWAALQKYVKRCGIQKTISPHKLRHSYASHMLKGGANIRVIQKLLGHNSIETTSIYLQVVDNELIDSVQEFHPRY